LAHIWRSSGQFCSISLIDQTIVVDAMRQGLQLQDLKLHQLLSSSEFIQNPKSGRFEFYEEKGGAKKPCRLSSSFDGRGRIGRATQKAMHAKKRSGEFARWLS
jgi:hypothetical protein